MKFDKTRGRRFGIEDEPSSERRMGRRAPPSDTDIVAVLERLPTAALLYERRGEGCRLCFANASARARLAAHALDGDLAELEPEVRVGLEALASTVLEEGVEARSERIAVRGDVLQASASSMGPERAAVLLEPAAAPSPVEPKERALWSAISHELRTPLTSLRAALSLLEAGLLGTSTDETGYLLAAASRNADRLIGFVNELLERDAADAGNLQLQVRSVDLDRALRRAIEPLRQRAAARGVDIMLQNELRGALRGDEGRLVHAFFLLLEGALSRSPDGGCVTVRCDRSGPGLVRVSVADGASSRGRGVPWSSQYAADRNARGAIGSTVVQSIAELHGGRSGLDQTDVHGVESWIELPARATLRSSGEIPRFGVRVAVITADEDLAGQLTISLRELGFEPLVFPTAEAAAFTLGRGAPPGALLFHGGPGAGTSAALLGRVGGNAHTRVPLVVIGPIEAVAGCPLPLVAALDLPLDEQRLARLLGWATRPKTKPRALLLGSDPIERDILARKLDVGLAEWIEADTEHEALRVAANADIDIAVVDAAALDNGAEPFAERMRRVSKAPVLVHTTTEPPDGTQVRHFLKTREDDALAREVGEILSLAFRRA